MQNFTKSNASIPDHSHFPDHSDFSLVQREKKVTEQEILNNNNTEKFYPDNLINTKVLEITKY
jgi:hypothetical protein